KQDRATPVKAKGRRVLRQLGADVRFEFGALLGFRIQARLDVDRLAGAGVDTAQDAVLPFAVDDVGVFGVGLAVVAVEAEQVEPFGGQDAGSAAGGAGAAPGAVVLKAAVDPVRFAHVRADGIELGNGQVAQMLPALAAVVGEI